MNTSFDQQMSPLIVDELLSEIYANEPRTC